MGEQEHIDHRLCTTVSGLGRDLKPVLDRIPGTGCRGVQLPAGEPGTRPRDLDGLARRGLSRELSRRQLELRGFDLWIPMEHFASAGTVDRATGVVIETIQLCHQMGNVPLSLRLPVQDPQSPSPQVDQVNQTILAASEAHGVMLVDFSDHERPEGVKVGLDPAALLADGVEPSAAIEQAGPDLGSVRLVDLMDTGMRGPVGFGADNRLDLMAFKVALDVNGFLGSLVIDTRQWEDPWAGLHLSIQSWASIQ